MSDFSNPIFHDAEKARKWLEARIWSEVNRPGIAGGLLG